MELTRETLAKQLSTDDKWLDKCAAFLLAKTAEGKGPDGLTDEQIMDIQYWGAWVMSKRSILGDHKKKAIATFTEPKMLDWLFNAIVEKYSVGSAVTPMTAKK